MWSLDEKFKDLRDTFSLLVYRLFDLVLPPLSGSCFSHILEEIHHDLGEKMAKTNPITNITVLKHFKSYNVTQL